MNFAIQKNELKGYFIQIKGRFQRSTRKTLVFKRTGHLAFNNLNTKLKVAYGTLYTKFGVAGLKIVFSY